MCDQPNYNGTNLKINSLYGVAKIDYMRNNGSLKFTPDHMKYFLIETLGAFKLSYKMTTQEDFNNMHLLPLYLTFKVTNPQV